MKTIAVIFGGQSVEHDVSIVTALASVIKPLELTKKYTVIPVYISKNGEWFCHDALKNINLYTSGEIEQFLKKQNPVSIELNGTFTLINRTKLSTKKQLIDLVFPAMHGTKGEDGSLMGLLEMTNTPYVGCTLSASVLAMDKILAKTIVQASGITVAKFLHFTSNQVEEDLPGVLSKCMESLQFPLYIKPPHLGSSIGISKVVNKTELLNAIEVAIHYDDSVLIEEAVDNLIEVTLPVMGNSKPIPSLLESPRTTDEKFFDFDTKYMQGGKKGKGAFSYSELPAKLSKKLYSKVEKVGVDSYQALGCTGIARVDMLIDSKKDEVYFNEINPLPGDLYAHNWAQKGISKIELVDKLVEYAIERDQKKSQFSVTFDTNYLKQF